LHIRSVWCSSEAQTEIAIYGMVHFVEAKVLAIISHDGLFAGFRGCPPRSQLGHGCSSARVGALRRCKCHESREAALRQLIARFFCVILGLLAVGEGRWCRASRDAQCRRCLHHRPARVQYLSLSCVKAGAAAGGQYAQK
jgi:hypothetical protein